MLVSSSHVASRSYPLLKSENERKNMKKKNVFPIFHNRSSTQAAKYCILTFIESVLLGCNKSLSNAESVKSCHGNLDERRGDLGCLATSRRTNSVKELNLSYNHEEQLQKKWVSI